MNKILHLCIRVITLFLYINLNALPNIILIGPPGAGKGTFAQMLVDCYHYSHICPGALLRLQAEHNTPLGMSIKTLVEQAKPIDSKFVWYVVENQLKQALNKHMPFILDGFPKNQECLHLLNKFLVDHGLIDSTVCIYFFAQDNVCYERITTRIECHSCHHTFNELYKLPQIANMCNVCHQPLLKRKGDDQHTALYRLTDFHENIEPIARIVKKSYYTLELDTSRLSLADVYNSYYIIIQQLEKLNTK